MHSEARGFAVDIWCRKAASLLERRELTIHYYKVPANTWNVGNVPVVGGMKYGSVASQSTINGPMKRLFKHLYHWMHNLIGHFVLMKWFWNICTPKQHDFQWPLRSNEWLFENLYAQTMQSHWLLWSNEGYSEVLHTWIPHLAKVAHSLFCSPATSTHSNLTNYY